MKGAIEQIYGGEGETAILYKRRLLNSNLRGGVFTTRHLKR